jgi:hypothetical protein
MSAASTDGNRPTLKGTWEWQSFLVLPKATEGADPPASVTARRWAKGKLTIPNDTDEAFSGELALGPSVTLSVNGRVSPATDSRPALLEATGEALGGPIKGTRYQILGWLVQPASDPGERLELRGSVRAERGPAIPNTNPVEYAKNEPGGMPVGTVGACVLTPA